MSNESFMEHNLRAINWSVYTQQIYNDFTTILSYDVMPKRVYSLTTPTPCLGTPVHVETKKTTTSNVCVLLNGYLNLLQIPCKVSK